VPFSAWVLDNYVAPDMSKFTAASIDDMSQVDKEQAYWLANFFLNNVAGPVQYVSPNYQQFFNFLRRSHAAFAEYAIAREASLGYLTDPRPDRDVLRYIEAVNHWEAFLGYAWQAFSFVGRGEPVWFQPKDGSVLQRLNALYNRSKHAEAAIERGDYIEPSPLCVWLTNAGLSSTDATLTFPEIAEILVQMAQIASAIQHPASVQSKVKEYLAEIGENGENDRSDA